MLSKLNGYKTYALVALAVIYGVSGFFTGHLDGKSALDIIWAALTAGSIRHAVANS